VIANDTQLPGHERHSVLAMRELIERTSTRVRVTQLPRAALAIACSLLAFSYVLHGRVATSRLVIWTVLVAGVTAVRWAQGELIRRRLETTSAAKLHRDDFNIALTTIVHSATVGSGFWIVASSSDSVVALTVTVASVLFTVPTIIGAATRYWMVSLGALVNLGQGALFWLGVGGVHESLPAVGVMLIATVFLFATQAHVYSVQFADSVRIRTDNIELLARLEEEKQFVERALTEAREASASKSRFLAAASHDLRQPLHALSMFLGTLSLNVTTDEARRLLGRINETTRVLEEQFDSLLDLSRFDAGVVVAETKSFRLDNAVARIIDEVRSQIEAKGLSVVAEVCPAVGKSDPVLIGRVLRNLLDNAVKYTPSGTVKVRVTEQPNNLLVEVIDTGPGIAADQQPMIFDEYVQLSNPARQRSQGVGLGLAIVKRIDLLLGLGLTLHSTVGEGSTFAFLVPRATAEDSPSVREATRNPVQFRTARKIWILDDDPIGLESLETQLAAWGATVEAFSSPESLLAKLRDGAAPPDWVFTDDMLGASLSGLQTAKLIAAHSRLTNVCLVTGNTRAARLAELRSSGFPVIVKPAKPEQLIAVIGD
jgi:two-component system, sensor histidine kinase